MLLDENECVNVCVCVCVVVDVSLSSRLSWIIPFFRLVTDSVLSLGLFETQMAGALVQSSLEEVIKRFIDFGPNLSSDSISIPAAIHPNTSSSGAVHPKCI